MHVWQTFAKQAQARAALKKENIFDKPHISYKIQKW